MNKLRKLSAFILVCLMVLSVAACAERETPQQTDTATPTPDVSTQSIGEGGMSIDSDAEAVESDRVLRVAVSQDSGTLYPYSCTAFGFSGVARTFQDVLFDYKSNGDIEYLLATGWEEGDGENRYTLHLRQGVTFTNGNPFTAEDVIFSMEVSREHPQYFSNVDSIDFEKTVIIDDYTIDLQFTHLDIGQFPGLMLMYIYDKESFDEQAMATQSIGTGPYYVTDYVTNSHVHVEANPNYWGEQPTIQKIEFSVIDEAAQTINALTIGQVDFSRIQSDDYEYVSTLGNYKVWPTMSGSAALAYFNCAEGSILGTVEARKAICHAIDTETINLVCYDNLSRQPRWPNSEACLDFEERFVDPSDDVYGVGYDPELAKAEVEAAGIAGQKIRIMTNGTENFILMAEIIEQDLKAVGLEAEIINYDQATYWGLLMDESNFEIALYMNGSPKNLCLDMYPAYLEFFGLGLVGNAKREAFVALGNRGLATADEQERSDILNQLGRDFNEITAWYAMAENLALQAVSNDLGTIEKYNDGEVRYAHWYWVN